MRLIRWSFWEHYKVWDISAEPRLSDILSEVSAQYGVSLAELKSRDRSSRVARPRQVYMARAAQETTKSRAQIGRLVNRTSWTVAHAIEVYAAREAETVRVAA